MDLLLIGILSLLLPVVLTVDCEYKSRSTGELP
jgi:hypothetical protein